MKIEKIIAREILDSRAWPTVEVSLFINEKFFSASFPAGASKGKYEAKEIRDGKKRYFGKGVKKVISNIKNIIAPKLIGKDFSNQYEFDKFLIELDGRDDKSRLGANAILPLSIAFLKAFADSQNLPLYLFIRKIFLPEEKRFFLPKPCFNIINGGVHAGNQLSFQEFMIIPQYSSFAKNLQIGVECYHTLAEILTKKYGKGARNLGDEGGFAPQILKTLEALTLIKKALSKRKVLRKVKLAIDCAASCFFKKNYYFFETKKLKTKKLLDFYLELSKNYQILFLEDPFSQDDFDGWVKLTKIFKKEKIFVVGDDLTVTNPKRIKIAKRNCLCNGVIIKPNQIGTVTETLEFAKLAKCYNWKIIVSHRSGETTDDFIADLAVGISADFLKAGAPARGERVVKYNRLLLIESELKEEN